MTSGLVDGLVPPRSLSGNDARRVPHHEKKKSKRKHE